MRTAEETLRLAQNLVDEVSRTNTHPVYGTHSSTCQLAHACGIVGEIGELNDAIHAKDFGAALSEYGDVVWYLVALAMTFKSFSVAWLAASLDYGTLAELTPSHFYRIAELTKKHAFHSKDCELGILLNIGNVLGSLVSAMQDSHALTLESAFQVLKTKLRARYPDGMTVNQKEIT